MPVFWDDPTVVWDDPNVSWDGDLLTAVETATLQSVATLQAEGLVYHRDAEVTFYAVALFDIDGVLVDVGESTLQAVATFEAIPPGAEAVEGEVTMQAVATCDADAAEVQPGAATMQSVATISAEAAAQVLAGETTMQSVATFSAETAPAIVHAAEALLQTVAFLLADAEIRARATGEWYIRGGTFYPPPFNRRKMRQRAHLGTGRRVG